MMHTWFETGIRYEKVMPNGANKKVTELYLVDALSFTEAEARIIENTKPYIQGDFTVVTIKRVNLSEIFPSSNDVDDKYYRCKLNFITLDEKSGAEKKTASYVLVEASDTKTAELRLHEGMKGTMVDYKIEAIIETKLLDVYPYEEEEETENTK